jgi:hypothetical protein
LVAASPRLASAVNTFLFGCGSAVLRLGGSINRMHLETAVEQSRNQETKLGIMVLR